MTYINREIEEKINKLIERKEIIGIRGPRQAGKTTLLKNIYEKH
jgi:predicted AAA+ superfamily ATPase